MKTPRNATEAAVDIEMRRLQDSGPVAATPCWCEACQADIRALSLSTLPPNYCTTFDFDRLLEETSAEKVHNIVAFAVERVSRYPKHHRFQDPDGLPEFRLVNFGLEEANAIAEEMALREQERCACLSCRSDTMAYALNRYPSKYGVERSGHVDFPASERESIRRELSSIMSRAATVVASRPRHR